MWVSESEKSKRAIVMIVLTLILMGAGFPLFLYTPERAVAYTPRDPIFIEGDGNFTVENGVVSGNGTWKDPYIIEGWEIQNKHNYSSGIEIRNTTAHFVLKDTFVIVSAGSPWESTAIFLWNVSNGRIENTTSQGRYSVRLEFCRNITVTNNTILSSYYGVYLYHSDDGSVTSNNITGSIFGIRMDFSTNNSIDANELTLANYYPIFLVNSSFTKISSNGITDRIAYNDFSIILKNSYRIEIVNNSVLNNVKYGIYVHNSNSILVLNNTISNNRRYGIRLHESNRTKVIGNKLTMNGIIIEGVLLSHFNSHTITSDNLVNGNPVYYYKNCSNLDVDNITLGQLLVANCSKVRIANLQIQDTDVGIETAFVEDAIIESNDVRNSWYGIYQYRSNNVTTRENNLSLNIGYGVYMSSSSNSSMEHNNILSNGRQGVRLLESRNITLLGNSADSNVRDGIFILQSSDVRIRNNNLSRSEYGVYLSTSDSITIKGNTIARNENGTYLLDSTNIIVLFNNIFLNTQYGIYLGMTKGNFVHHNNITENRIQGLDYTIGGNKWDDGYPSGGNYWSDYLGIDEYSGPKQDQPGKDGMGDTPYYVDEDSFDRYPLMAPKVELEPPRIGQALINGELSQTYVLGDIPELNLASVVNDEETGNTSIGGANYTIGLANWSSSSPMYAKDGSFDSSFEEAYAILEPPTEEGVYTYCVYAWDVQANFNTSSSACARIDILNPPLEPIMLDAALAGPELSDVTIRWLRSGDDGAGENDIIRYDIYRSTNYSGPYIRIANISANGSLTYSWVCAGCGDGNPNNYFFYVEAYDGILATASPNKAGKFTRQLVKGPNLVSIPLIQEDRSIEKVLQTVKFDEVWTYDPLSGNWKSYSAFKPYKGSLRKMDGAMGFWVNVTKDCNFTVAGIVPNSTSILLKKGWNLVSFPSFKENYSVIDLKSQVNATKVEGFDSSNKPYYLVVMQDTEKLRASFGYWVMVTEDTYWVVSS